MTHRILLAEDDLVQRQMTGALLTKQLGYTVEAVVNGEEAVKRVQSSKAGEISAVLLDVNMPVMDGFTALKIIRESRPDIPVLMLSGSDNRAVAARAMKEGASDFIIKPPDPMRLAAALKKAI